MCRSRLDHPGERLELAHTLMKGLPVKRITNFMSAVPNTLTVCVLYHPITRPSESVRRWKREYCTNFRVGIADYVAAPTSCLRYTQSGLSVIPVYRANSSEHENSARPYIQHADPFN